MKFARIAALAAATLALAAAPFAHAQDKVSLRLNWYLGGLHVPFYYGKDKGYYAAEGIDLTINEGRGSANTVQVVAAGSDTFGLADSSSVILTAAKGADIKSVMSLLNTTGYSVVSLTDANIKTPKDLEGKKVAVTAGDPLGSLLQAVCKANNVDCAKIGMVQVDPAAKVVAVLEKKSRRAARRRRRPVLPHQVQGRQSGRDALRRLRRQHRRHDDPDVGRHDQEESRPREALRARDRASRGTKRRRIRARRWTPR